MTDIGDWYTWFANEELQGNNASWRDNITRVLYHEYGQSTAYPRLEDPGGENEIVMILSGHDNSRLKSLNAEPATALFGQPWNSPAHTLPNAKEIYRRLLGYFRTRPNKMFVVVTAPGLEQFGLYMNTTEAGNARALNLWLVNDWLRESDPSWEHKNVFVFDLYNVLSDQRNHHWVEDGEVRLIAHWGDPFIDARYSLNFFTNELSRDALEKATAELGPVLNVYYHRWREWLGKE
jgi:hypothetical protein